MLAGGGIRDGPPGVRQRRASAYPLSLPHGQKTAGGNPSRRTRYNRHYGLSTQAGRKLSGCLRSSIFMSLTQR